MSESKSPRITLKSKKQINNEKLKEKQIENKDEPSKVSDASDSDIQLFQNQFQLELDTPKKRVKVSTFKGKVLIHLREYYQKDGKWLPGAKGTTITPQQWEVLKNNINKIDKAITKLT